MIISKTKIATLVKTHLKIGSARILHIALCVKMCFFLLKGLHGVNTSFTSPLDETLDKEVLLMLQGPHPEHMAQEFRRLINKMVKLLR